MSNAATIKVGHVYYSGNSFDPHLDEVVAVTPRGVEVAYRGRAKSGAFAGDDRRTVALDVFLACYHESHDAMIAAHVASQGPESPWAGAQLPGGR